MRSRELRLSLLLLGAVLLFVCAGLAFDANWPKLLRVSTAFATYALALLFLPPRTSSFLVAGALAGAASGLVRPETTAALVLVSVAGGVAFGFAHRLGVQRFRDARASGHVVERPVR